VRALTGVSFTITAGELLCLIGPNGCGKTTLFNAITGAFPPSAGKVFWQGEDITALPPHLVARLGIARKFQVPGIYPKLSVIENVEIAAASAAAPKGLLGLAASDSGQLAARLGPFGLAAHAAAPAGSLSHGQKQWLEIAMLTATGAKLMLLDEPTAGMTPSETEATADLIARMRTESGIAVLAIEHDVQFVRRLDCPVMVMLRGSVYRRGSYADIRADDRVREAYFGQVN
jgi:ABC-type uncharacterized transport system ATPase subunit